MRTGRKKWIAGLVLAAVAVWLLWANRALEVIDRLAEKEKEVLV